MVDRPIVLLPVRLETRVEPRADGNFGLKIRVYPDDVAIDAHDPRLTTDELAWAGDFRERSALGPAARAEAWGGLVGRYGGPRSAWLAGALDANGNARYGDRPSAWSRAPRTTVLPDRWLAYGYRANNTSLFTAMGAPIPPGTQLHTGPDPAYPGGFGAGPGADPASLWIVDFGAALNRGMALEVTLTPDQRAQLDRVLVVGWRAADGQTALENLLWAHHYTGGLGLVAQGTPTNNTPETPAGDVLDELTPAESLDLELGSPQMGSAPAPDGLAVANALRVSRSLFEHVRRANGVEQLDAHQMNTALWPATWGYFLSRLMTGAFTFDDVLDPNALGTRARQHFITHVRARGPLPALRIGRQPYGVLPAISLDRWTNIENDPLDTVLVSTLRSLRPVWSASAASVPQVSGVSARADDDLVAILGNDAVSSSYQGRPVVGPGYFDYLFRFLSTAMRDWWTQQKAEAPPAQSPIQFPTNPLVSRAVFPGEHFVLDGPLVRPRPDLDPDLPLPANQNYLSWLRGGTQSTYDSIALRRFFQVSGPVPGDGGATPLLYRLLRHAALLEYQAGAFWYLGTTPANRKETELVNISPRPQDATTTVWNMLGQTAQGLALPIGRVLDGARSSYGGWVPGRFHEFWTAIDHLAQRPAGTLEQLMAETLDLCSFRLDAWITSMAHKRLITVQNQAPAGVYLGGYGWVEQLSSTLQRPPSSGFVHAASLDQAAAAAVLRSGYLAHRNGGPDGPFAVDLSSERVRLAKWLLEGTRTQPLGALLGYRFERGLHEHQPPLDQYIAAFRQLAPLDGTSLQPGEAALTNVVDGLTLNRLSKQQPGIPWGATGFPPADPLDLLHAGVQSVLDVLDRTVDAASDAVLAESVYQTVRGNPLRAGAILDAVARGEVVAPELQSARTPRSGVGVTQRVVVLFGGDPTLDAAWTPGPLDAPRQARAIAEPMLNAWAGQLLGDPRRVRCRAEYVDPQTGDALDGRKPVEVRLADLGLCPLDVVFLSASSDRVQAAELEQRLAYHLLSPSGLPPGLAPVIPPGAGVRLAFGRDPAWPADVLSFPELLEVARGARTLIQGARALAPADLTPPRPAGGTAVLNVVEVQNRAQTVLTALGAVAAQLAAWDLTTRREGLLRAAHFGISGAVPLSAAGDTPSARQALDTQIAVIAPEVNRRLAAASVVTLPANPTADDQVACSIGQLQAVLEPAFRVLPRFQPANASALQAAFEASTSLQSGDAFQVSTWLQRMARVRDGVSNLAAALTYAQAVGSSTGQLRVAQLPYQAGDVWAGVPGAVPRAASLGLVAYVPARFGSGSTTVPSGGDIGGLFVDEIVEVVPADRETTGVAFNYDEPNARAPQAILVAVPATADPWSAEALAATVLETIELARIRGVDPDALRQAGQFLPALYVATNLALDTVATDLTGYDQSHPALPPNDAQFVSQSGPGPVIADELFTMSSITFRNVGLSTWTSSGPHPFRLGWSMPANGSAWSAPNQFDLPGGPIAPGDQVAFSMTLRAPAQAGVRSLMWRMMQVLDDGPHPFGAPTSVANIIIVEPLRNAAFVSQTVPSALAINETASVSLTFRNTGNSTWRSASGYCLGSESPRDNNRWGLGRVGLSEDVSPGGRTTFTFTITAPARANTYAFQWCMLQESIAWFGELSPVAHISVYDPKDKDTKENDKFTATEVEPIIGPPVPAGLVPTAPDPQADPKAPGAATFIQPAERPIPGAPPSSAAEASA